MGVTPRRLVAIAKYLNSLLMGAVVAVCWYVAPTHRTVASLLAIACIGLAFGCGYFSATYEPWIRDRGRT